ncbi:UvrD-helicase domain-containing protein [Klebsiella pneumoniae]|uniref:UvrD-helicase domain-containing protein n=1 Tax=Klebsiella pneumoniae TaxID=573 RepID=UPI00388E0391
MQGRCAFCHDIILRMWFAWLTLYHQSVNLGSVCYNPTRSKVSKTPMRLNPGQQQTVEFIHRTVPGAGGRRFGKTRVITNKIAHLIRGCDYQARHIAAVTFTNKAAREMKKRVGQTLERKEARGLMISTFHTLGLDIIKREYAALGDLAFPYSTIPTRWRCKELTEG